MLGQHQNYLEECGLEPGDALSFLKRDAESSPEKAKALREHEEFLEKLEAPPEIKYGNPDHRPESPCLVEGDLIFNRRSDSRTKITSTGLKNMTSDPISGEAPRGPRYPIR